MWSILKSVDPSLTSSDTLRKSSLDSKPQLKKFMDHCCVIHKYITKCGSLTCSICKPPHLPQEIFKQIKFLPDPMPVEEGHYKPFSEVYGTTTSEEHCPSSTKKTKRRKTLPFPSNLKRVQNVDMMLQCEECDVRRLLYSQKKLTYRERTQLEEALSDFTFTCGAPLQDLDLPGKLADVYVQDIVCGEPVEKLYYSAKYPPICLQCATPVDPNTESDHYPQCTDCSGRPHIKKEWYFTCIL